MEAGVSPTPGAGHPQVAAVRSLRPLRMVRFDQGDITPSQLTLLGCGRGWAQFHLNAIHAGKEFIFYFEIGTVSADKIGP